MKPVCCSPDHNFKEWFSRQDAKVAKLMLPAPWREIIVKTDLHKTGGYCFRSWGLPLLLARGDEVALREVIHRFQHAPDALIRAMGRNAVATHALAQLQAAGLGDDQIRARLQPVVAWELGFTARRRLALQALNGWAERVGVQPLLIKGAATSRTYYPQETWRVSQDVDFVLPQAQIANFFPADAVRAGVEAGHSAPEDHGERVLVHGLPVEAHFRVGVFPHWGTPPDLGLDSEPCPGYPHLRVPAATVALTIALVHLYKHLGQMPYDLLDLTRIVASGRVNWAEATELWKERGLAPVVLPGLVILAAVSNGVPDPLIPEFAASLTRPERRTVCAMTTYVFSGRFRFLREQRVVALMEERSFLRQAAGAFLGSPEVTRRLTGLNPRQPLFWVQHLAVQPARRLWRCLH